MITTTFKLCGSCSKTTSKDSKGKKDIVSVTKLTYEEDNRIIKQSYHTECLD